ncbi:MAG: division/cell wall cluster transcriptional repressor MraZ [Treponemataceae bacterium]|nr:MAG: division/cell wall cluster transcriptional repressor MraZ [Treponemataceae bacterium]
MAAEAETEKLQNASFSLCTGEYKNTMDEKGRILFPTKLRSALNASSFIITQGLDNCLWIFTQSEWQNLCAKIMESASVFNTQNRLVLRRFIAPAQEIEIDAAGRLSVPQVLREYASLSKDCVVLGVSKYIELWDADIYRTYLEQSDSSFKEATEVLSSIYF